MKIKQVFVPVWYSLISILFLELLLFSCSDKPHNENKTVAYNYSEKVDEVEIHTASGFSITRFNDYSVIEVYKPWQGAEELSFRYILAENDRQPPDSLLSSSTLIRVPVNRVVCTSTTHIAFLESLGKADAIVGVSGSDLISNEKIQKKINSGKVHDIGYGRELNYETLILLKPDLVMLYGVESEMTGFIQKLAELDIPVVMNGEYLEEEPLGKYEWIKFTASFFGLDEKAGRMYDSVVNVYEILREKAINISIKPTVMTGLPWKDVWYVSPENTSIANFIQDAGARYLWSGLKSVKAVPMDLEAVYEKSGDVDYWINPGAAESLNDILNVDSRFEHFLPVKNSKIYNNNAKMNLTGGNDYWESGVIHPDIVLKDLIRIFHPDLLPDYELVYYKKIL